MYHDWKMDLTETWPNCREKLVAIAMVKKKNIKVTWLSLAYPACFWANMCILIKNHIWLHMYSKKTDVRIRLWNVFDGSLMCTLHFSIFRIAIPSCISESWNNSTLVADTQGVLPARKLIYHYEGWPLTNFLWVTCSSHVLHIFRRKCQWIDTEKSAF